MALLIFAITFLVYLLTLPGTVPAYRDSGDMINAVFTLGIAHPPGYPLYVLTANLFSHLVPLANPAYRVNLFSAFSAAATATVLYAVTVTDLKRSRDLCLSQGSNVVARCARAKLVCFFGAILFALTPAVLSLARAAEMYTFAALLGVMVLGCYLAPTPRAPLLGSYLVGLGFGVHPTLVFLAPLFVPIKLTREAVLRLALFFLGFSCIFFLYLRAHTEPLQNWGNPSSLDALWNLITRSNYGGLKLHPVESQFAWTLAGIFDQLMYFFRRLLQEWGWACFPLGFLGIFSARRWRLVLCGLLLGPGFFVLSNLPLSQATTGPILQPALVLLNVLWAFWVIAGLVQLEQAIPSPVIRALLWVGIPVCTLLFMLPVPSYRTDMYAYDLGRNWLRTLPPHAVIYDPDDPIAFTLRAEQLIKHRRTDVILLNFFRTRWGYRQIIQRWPDLLPPVPVNSAQELEALFWSYSIHRYPFFVDLPMKVPGRGYDIEGIAYRVIPPGEQEDQRLSRAVAFEPFYVWRGTWRTNAHDDFFTQHLINYRAAARCNLGLKYATRSDWAPARRYYQESLAIDPTLAPAYNNLGVMAYHQKRFDQAQAYYQKALFYDPANAGYQRNLDLVESLKKR